MIQSKKTEKIIQILSIAVPIIVALILGMRLKVDLGSWTKTLPHFIGLLNGITALFLIVGFTLAKNRYLIWHERVMLSAFGMGALFLVLYILYHISNENTSSAGMGSTERGIYFFLLVSHILLSVIVVRFVLLAIYYALTKQYDRHKKIVKWTFPLWLYVSVTGVLVYLMISPYYV
jgi:putative membrane protein